jgi:hypothetical protein
LPSDKLLFQKALFLGSPNAAQEFYIYEVRWIDFVFFAHPNGHALGFWNMKTKSLLCPELIHKEVRDFQMTVKKN